MNEDPFLLPERSWTPGERELMVQLTLILGQAHLLRRWAARSAHLGDDDRAMLLARLGRIDQAAWALHQGITTTREPPSAETPFS